MRQTSGNSSQASSTIREISRRCSGYLKDHDRYYLVLSESEYLSWQQYGWIRSPRLSNELASAQDQVFHAIRMFNRLGDAINHLYYLRVAHGFMFNCHSETGHGRFYIYSGTLRGKVEDIPRSVIEESRARILRIVIDQDSMSYTDQVKYKKVKLHQFFTYHQIWSAETEMFTFYQDCFIVHDSARIVPRVSCDLKLVSLRNHLGDHAASSSSDSLRRVIKIIQRQSSSHGSSSHIRRRISSESVTELEIDRSFTVVDMRINPWEVKESTSSSMEVDDSAFRQRGKRSSGSNPGSAVLTISAGRLTFT